MFQYSNRRMGGVTRWWRRRKLAARTVIADLGYEGVALTPMMVIFLLIFVTAVGVAIVPTALIFLATQLPSLQTGLLTTPLRDRFGMTFRLEYYEASDLGVIVRRSAGILGVELEGDAADQIAARSRGTPRVANRILRRVRDVAEVRHEGVITPVVAAEALELLEVDGYGLERTDRELLRAIVERFDGGPVGLSTLAVALGEERDTVEDVYEPYLLQLGFIQRTPRGRIVTKLGREHVGATKAEEALF